ncbi:flagellar biosynthesis protein FlhG [Nitrosospira sp. Nsp5]|uniref:Flagellar biosynthesis protein FlhG n=1 Tax=Nitrosospira multiformis TaxID=1231 RepID=A0ABY0TE01_9PROT|nr:flagellar biosynthesis protein FlhG [Nitrosospira sp. Nsp5]SDQ68742.1 flagellar biosynthesis protein FlhG [Nitrosospira multiformis]
MELILANPTEDQAEGLRRLLAQDSPHIITVVSGSVGAGKTSTVINLAAALARNGKDVLVIDENAGATNLAGTLGLSAHRDLLDVIRRDKTLDEVIISGPDGIRLLPAGRGMPVLGKLGLPDQTHLINCFDGFSQPMDVLLIDAAPGRISRMLSLALSSHEIVVVVSPEPASITAAYALIKHISGDHGIQRFSVLLNRTVIETEAQMIFDNMAGVASRYLAVSLDFMGFIPPDDKLRQSNRRGHSVIEAFPAAISATAFRRAAEALTHGPRCEGEGNESNEKGLGGFMQCLMQGSQSQRQHASNNGGNQDGSIKQSASNHPVKQGDRSSPVRQINRNNIAAKGPKGPVVRHV